MNGLEQKTGFFQKMTYAFSEGDMLHVSFKSPTNQWTRSVDIKTLNPNPIYEKNFPTRPTIAGSIFLLLGIMWLCNLSKDQTENENFSLLFLGIIFSLVGIFSFCRAYFQNQELKAFANIFTNEIAVVFFVNKKSSSDVNQFVDQLSQLIKIKRGIEENPSNFSSSDQLQ